MTFENTIYTLTGISLVAMFWIFYKIKMGQAVKK